MTKYKKLMLLHEEIYKKINPVSYGYNKHYSKYTIKGEELTSNFINEIINDCEQLYNQLNNEIIVLIKSEKMSKETYNLIKDTILAKKSVEFREINLVQLKNGQAVQHPNKQDLPKGLVNIIELLKRSLYHSEYYSTAYRDAFFDTARLSFNTLERSLINLIKKLES